MRCVHCGSNNAIRNNRDWNTNRETWKCYKCGGTWQI